MMSHTSSHYLIFLSSKGNVVLSITITDEEKLRLFWIPISKIRKELSPEEGSKWWKQKKNLFHHAKWIKPLWLIVQTDFSDVSLCWAFRAHASSFFLINIRKCCRVKKQSNSILSQMFKIVENSRITRCSLNFPFHWTSSGDDNINVAYVNVSGNGEKTRNMWRQKKKTFGDVERRRSKGHNNYFCPSIILRHSLKVCI